MNRMLRGEVSRRRFVKGMAGVVAAPIVVPGSVLGAGAVSPSERIAVAMIGTGGMNGGHLSTLVHMPEAQVIATVDPQRDRRESAKRVIETTYAARQREGTFAGVTTYNDYRELLARKDIDAVFIATPDHWHAPITIAACAAGKDVYCEKPLTNTIAAGQAVCRAVRRHGRVLQVGLQQRSDGRFRQACELVRNGRIGKLHTIRAEVPGGSDSGAVPPTRPAPEGFDYDLWLGGAPWRPYSPQRVQNSYWWHIYDYGIGFQAGWGVHHTDIAQWGNGTDQTGPVEAQGTAVFPKDGLCDTPVSWKTELLYANGVRLLFSSWGGERVTFEGTEGWVQVSRGHIDASPKSLLQSRILPNETHLEHSNHHIGNFLECIRTRKDPIVPVETGHRSNVICIISDIAIRLGRKVRWNPVEERFEGDEMANRMLARAMRAPWRLE